MKIYQKLLTCLATSFLLTGCGPKDYTAIQFQKIMDSFKDIQYAAAEVHVFNRVEGTDSFASETTKFETEVNYFWKKDDSKWFSKDVNANEYREYLYTIKGLKLTDIVDEKGLKEEWEESEVTYYSTNRYDRGHMKQVYVISIKKKGTIESVVPGGDEKQVTLFRDFDVTYVFDKYGYLINYLYYFDKHVKTIVDGVERIDCTHGDLSSDFSVEIKYTSYQ